MSDLYVSDLDGTLLRSNERTSEYTNQVINSLVEKGMVFSYATARSLVTAKKVVNWKNKFQLSHTSDWNLLLQGYGVELTSPNIPAWY